MRWRRLAMRVRSIEGLRATVAAAVDYVVEGIERGEDRAGPIPAEAAEQARRAARAGVPLNTVLRRYMAGHTLFEQFVMDEADRAGEGGMPPLARESLRVALRGALRAQAAVLDRLLERIAQEYGDGLRAIGRSPQQRRAELVRSLLTDDADEDRVVAGGAVESRTVAGRVMDGVGLDYEIEDRWHLGAIAVGAGAAQAVRALAASADRRLLSVAQGERTVWAWLGGRERLAISPSPGGLSSTDEGVVLAIGEQAWGLAGWRSTHRQARAALTVAQRRSESHSGAGRAGVTRYADVALLAAAFNDEGLGRALIDVYVAPLEDARGGGPMLRETLRAYLAAERNASSAAVALGVARNTLESRLRTIEVRLGRTLHPCPAELEVALLLDELVSVPPSSERSIVG